MNDKRALAPWIKRFLLEYLPTDRNFARNTQHSYRDALRLFVIFSSAVLRTKPDELLVEDLSADLVRKFMRHIEEGRKCSVATRNQRLAALRTLAAFIGERSPEHLSWCAQIRSIPFKKSGHRPVGYLEKDEIDALLAVPDRTSRLGSRDYAMLLLLYNTGARADEAAQLTVGDLRLHAPQEKSQSFVQLRGKGNKIRFCPLWASTTAVLKELVAGRADEERVFLGRSARAMTRFGVHDIVTRYAKLSRGNRASLRHKRIGPHTIRHTTATHLLRAGVDINTIRAWLGHVSIDTTNIYAESDLEMKAKALGMCEDKLRQPRKRWRDNPDLLKFLAQL
jgi:site-specific recombinase XerD